MINTIDTAELRRKLAGIASKSRALGGAEHTEIRDTSIRIVCVLAHLYGEELDRLNLWNRIDSAIQTSCSKSLGEDFELWFQHALDHVKADPTKAAACQPLVQLVETAAARTEEWRLALVDHMATRRFSLLAKGRERWALVKEGKAEL